MIDTNLRSLKRFNLPTGSRYTLLPDSQRKNSRHLCTKCGIPRCDLRDDRAIGSKVYGHQAKLEVTECMDFHPPIGFQSTAGLVDGCNTLRLGDVWKKRVQKGDYIGLVNVATGELFGDATVLKVATGSKDDVLKRHAFKNHLAIDKGLGRARATEALTKLLPSIYGNLIYNNASKLTAIYLCDVNIF